MKLAIIIPTYNERENIIPLLEQLTSVMDTVKGYTVACLVVDDNSPDQTQILVTKYMRKHPNVYLLTGPKEGLGKALLRGITYAVDKLDADILLQMDADLSHDPKVIPQMLEKLQSGADFVIGSRYIPGGSIPDNWGIHRKIQSIAGNAIVRYGLGRPDVHDWTGGFRAYKKEYVAYLQHQLDAYRGYVFQIAFLHKALLHGATVWEVPIHFTDRRFGRSKIIPSEYIRNVFAYIISTRSKSKRIRKIIKFLMVGGLGFIINTIVLELFVLFGFHPSVGSAAGAECAIISNFLFNNNWTFRDRKIEKSARFVKFLQFNGTSLGAIGIQAGIVLFGTHTYGVENYRSFYLLGVFASLSWNYFMYSRVIWKKR